MNSEEKIREHLIKWMDQYNLSYRMVAERIKKHGCRVSHATVYNFRNGVKRVPAEFLTALEEIMGTSTQHKWELLANDFRQVADFLSSPDHLDDVKVAKFLSWVEFAYSSRFGIIDFTKSNQSGDH